MDQEFTYQDVVSVEWGNGIALLHLSNGSVLRYENVTYEEYLNFMKDKSICDAIKVFADISDKVNLSQPHSNNKER